jgi:hypothetical protein
MFTAILEWEYLISSLLGLLFCGVLLWGVDQARRENNVEPGPKRQNWLVIRRAGWRYSIVTTMFVLKAILGTVSLTGHFGQFGIGILAVQPDLLLALVFFEWWTDRVLMALRIRSRKRDQDEKREQEEAEEAEKEAEAEDDGA